MSSIPEPNEVIGANALGINRLGLECCDDMQGAQMGKCEVDSHDMSRPDKGYLACTHLTYFHLSSQNSHLGQNKVFGKLTLLLLDLSCQEFRVQYFTILYLHFCKHSKLDR